MLSAIGIFPLPAGVAPSIGPRLGYSLPWPQPLPISLPWAPPALSISPSGERGTPLQEAPSSLVASPLRSFDSPPASHGACDMRWRSCLGSFLGRPSNRGPSFDTRAEHHHRRESMHWILADCCCCRPCRSLLGLTMTFDLREAALGSPTGSRVTATLQGRLQEGKDVGDRWS